MFDPGKSEERERERRERRERERERSCLVTLLNQHCFFYIIVPVTKGTTLVGF